MTKQEKLNFLGQLLMDGQRIAHNDKELIEKLESGSKATAMASKAKAFKRHLDKLQELYPQIRTEVEGKIIYYYLETKVSSIIHEYLTTSDDMSWLVQMISSADKTLFAELESDTKERLSNVLSSEKDIFLFQSSAFDAFETEVGKQIFRSLKSAVKNNEYRNIHYYYNNKIILKDVKCLKLIFMENNWYVAIARKIDIEVNNQKEKEERLFFLRISFIEKVEYSSKNSYQPSQLNKYIDFFKTFQNPMSLYGQEKKIAHIKASAAVAKYFKPTMKKHLRSETFVRENSDGTVEFTLEYTQSMEIFPLIKKWLPNLKILSPSSLQDELEAELKSYLNS